MCSTEYQRPPQAPRAARATPSSGSWWDTAPMLLLIHAVQPCSRTFNDHVPRHVLSVGCICAVAARVFFVRSSYNQPGSAQGRRGLQCVCRPGMY